MEKEKATAVKMNRQEWNDTVESLKEKRAKMLQASNHGNEKLDLEIEDLACKFVKSIASSMEDKSESKVDILITQYQETESTVIFCIGKESHSVLGMGRITPDETTRCMPNTRVNFFVDTLEKLFKEAGYFCRQETKKEVVSRFISVKVLNVSVISEDEED